VKKLEQRIRASNSDREPIARPDGQARRRTAIQEQPQKQGFATTALSAVEKAATQQATARFGRLGSKLK
jgi:hypothetical protein